MTTISKQRLCGEDLQSVAEPLMAAVERSIDPNSEWHDRREALYDVIRNLPLASFDERARSLLQRLGVLAEQPDGAPEASDEPDPPSSETAPSVTSDAEEEGCLALATARAAAASAPRAA